MARRAHSLATLLAQANRLAPDRLKASDGWIGNLAHQKTESDHNPDRIGIVRAQDITHDPTRGMDIHSRAHALIADPRCLYVISNDTFLDKVNGEVRSRPYALVNRARTNKHVLHLHVSVVGSFLADDSRPWAAFNNAAPPMPAPVRPFPLPRGHYYGLKSGPNESHGGFYKHERDEVKTIQELLILDGHVRGKSNPNATTWDDGIFGTPTEAAVKDFQKHHGLAVDGKVGPKTWHALFSLRLR